MPTEPSAGHVKRYIPATDVVQLEWPPKFFSTENPVIPIWWSVSAHGRQDVAKMIQAMATLGAKVDLADVDNVRHLVQKISDAEAQRNLRVDTPETDVLKDLPQPPLRMEPLPPASAAAD